MRRYRLANTPTEKSAIRTICHLFLDLWLAKPLGVIEPIQTFEDFHDK